MGIRQLKAGKALRSILKTIGDTPTVRINNIAPDHVCFRKI
jgi:hypothetical protein